MSARHSKPVEAPRLRARTVLGGAAMTAVFLGGGAGVALADESPAPTEQGQDVLGSVDLSKNADFQKLRGDVDDILGKVPFFESDPLGTHQKSDDKGHWGSDHKWHHGSDCGCQHKSSDEDKKKSEDTKHPCPPKSEDTSKPKATESADTKSEDTTPKVQSIADVSDSTVDSASTSPSSSTDDSQVDSASTGDTTPVGAADTGDGSSSPGFTPTFTPAASSSPLDNPYALGGGAAAAALLGAYGVSMARRRTGAHRG